MCVVKTSCQFDPNHLTTSLSSLPTTGNNWACNKDDLFDDGDEEDACCLGCGPQEQFVNCADIAITGSGDNTPAKTTTTEKPKQTEASEVTTTKKPSETAAPRTDSGCRGVGVYAGMSGMDVWCVANCARNFCPETHCTCS